MVAPVPTDHLGIQPAPTAVAADYNPIVGDLPQSLLLSTNQVSRKFPWPNNYLGTELSLSPLVVDSLPIGQHQVFEPLLQPYSHTVDDLAPSIVTRSVSSHSPSSEASALVQSISSGYNDEQYDIEDSDHALGPLSSRAIPTPNQLERLDLEGTLQQLGDVSTIEHCTRELSQPTRRAPSYGTRKADGLDFCSRKQDNIFQCPGCDKNYLRRHEFKYVLQNFVSDPIVSTITTWQR